MNAPITDTAATVTFSFNGKNITALGDETIFQAARRNGYEIPHLCYSDSLRADGNCRACMVEIDGVSYGAFIIPGLIMLSLMTQGRAAYEHLYEVAKAYDARLTADLTAAERETLKRLLVKLAAGQGSVG